jgi:hypothetical protein
MNQKIPNPARNHGQAKHNLSRGPANDNAGRAVAPTPTGGALESLAALAMVLNRVDTSSVAGRSGLPLMQFKSRENNGTWSFGQRRTVVEDGSRWAVNPATFKWGFICFDNDNKPTERLVPISQPKPDVMQLPNTGFEWHEQWGVDLKCIDGADAGTEVTFKISTTGGIQAIAGLIDTLRDRLNAGEHDGKVAPILQLERDSYQNQFGQIWFPLLTIVDWMPIDGPAPAPKPASPPPKPAPPTAADQNSTSAQPRRRRVA